MLVLALASGSTGLAALALTMLVPGLDSPASNPHQPVSGTGTTGRRGPFQPRSRPRLAQVSASPGKGVQGAVIGFNPVLDTPTKRANLSDMGFFHVLILKVRACPVSTLSGLGAPTRKGGGMALYMCLNPAPPDGLDSQTVDFCLTKELNP